MNDRITDRLRRSFASLEESERAQRACPAPEAIWAAVHAVAPAGEADAIVAHLAGCPSCAADWRLAMRSADRPTTAAVAPAAAPRRLIPTLAPLAAMAAVLLLTVGLWLVPRLERAPSAYRMPGRAEIGSLVTDGATLDAADFVLRWTPGPKGTRYSVLVSDRKLGRLAGAEALLEPRYQVPPEALSRLEHGDLVLWQVEAILPDGRRFVSETVTARLR